MQLYSRWVLLLLIIVPLLAYLLMRRRSTAAVKFPSLSDIKTCPVSWRLRLRPLLTAARLLCLGLLIVALARPRGEKTRISEVSTEGVAIEVVVDRSGSMRAEMDYYGEKLNRLEVVKRVLFDFIKGDKKDLTGRQGDLIGMVTFAGYADTVCPLVLSHSVLLEFMKQTNIVRLQSEDGTAIGDAIALAAARLKKAEEEIQQRRARLGLADEQTAEASEAGGFKIKSKVMILLTDGRHNAGQYHPSQAVELAQKWGIKIYTIGIGSTQSFITIETPLGIRKLPTPHDLDEGLLKAIADNTGGQYGRADDAEALRQIVEEINKQEKTEHKSIQYAEYYELFAVLTWPAVLLLGLEILARCTVLRKIP